jgi:hypothetical protein
LGWIDSSSPYFESQRSHYWSITSNAARVSLEASAGSLSYKRDMNGDSAVNGSADYAVSLGTSSSTALTGSGDYPYLIYAGFNFHRSPTQAHCYLQLMSMTGKAVDNTGISSVTIRVTDASGSVSSDQSLTWFPARQEWGLSPYSFTDPTNGGMWWVSQIKVTTTDGSTATYSSSSPYTPYSIDYKTDTNYTATAVATDMLPAQCYMPPDSPGADETMYYIETVANASSASYDMDTKLVLYEAGNLNEWIALNDDGYNGVFADMKVPLKSGQTYYLKVVDLNGSPGTYSLRLNTGSFNNTASSATVALGEDAYENDDTYATAKEINAGDLQDRALTTTDEDWVKIVVP